MAASADVDVVVIGGGATGAGVLRDLAMRGLRAVLVERGDFASGTSGRYHGLLHSGARYIESDPVSARHCVEENAVLRRIAPGTIEPTGGYFVATPDDPDDYLERFPAACAAAGIDAEPVALDELFRVEPLLNREIRAAYRVPGRVARAVGARRRQPRQRAGVRRRGASVHPGRRIRARLVGRRGGRADAGCPDRGEAHVRLSRGRLGRRGLGRNRCRARRRHAAHEPGQGLDAHPQPTPHLVGGQPPGAAGRRRHPRAGAHGVHPRHHRHHDRGSRRRAGDARRGHGAPRRRRPARPRPLERTDPSRLRRLAAALRRRGARGRQPPRRVARDQPRPPRHRPRGARRRRRPVEHRRRQAHDVPAHGARRRRRGGDSRSAPTRRAAPATSPCPSRPAAALTGSAIGWPRTRRPVAATPSSSASASS